MSDVLRGNFPVRRPVEASEPDEYLTSRFEREALKKLGGSIAFVAKKRFIYGLEPLAGKGDPPKDKREGSEE